MVGEVNASPTFYTLLEVDMTTNNRAPSDPADWPTPVLSDAKLDILADVYHRLHLRLVGICFICFVNRPLLYTKRYGSRRTDNAQLNDYPEDPYT